MAFGMVFILNNLANLAFDLIPWLLIFGGVCTAADAFLYRFARNERNLFVFVCYLICSAVAIAFGICLLCIESLQEFVSIIFGIVLILFALYILISNILKLVKKESAAL